MNKDVIADRYGRFYEIPDQLSKLDCNLTCICLSYYRSEELTLSTRKSINWSSYNWYSGFLIKYWLALIRAVRHDKPSFVIASSDIPHILIGRLISRVFGIKFVADLYDNYESYGLSKLPFLKPLFRRSLRQADFILTVSDALNRRISSITKNHRILTIENAIDPKMFYDIPIAEARNALNLDLDVHAITIGFSGSLDQSRGANFVYQACSKVRECYPHSVLVLAGTIGKNCPTPTEGVIFLGALDHESMNLFYNAMNVNIIGMMSGDFGDFAFPQKAYEIIATSTPLITPQFGPMAEILKSTPNCFYTPGDPDSLVTGVINLIINPEIPELKIPTWTSQAKKIKKFLTA